MANTSQYNQNMASSQKQKLPLKVKGLAKSYGELVAVQGIDLTVERGEIFGLIGADGAGKTTIFHILGGVMTASAGQIEVFGHSPRDARSLIGYVPEKLSLYFDLTVGENIDYSAGLRRVPPDLLAELRAKYLALMGLEKYQNRLAGNLSGGMKRKLALCCVLVSQPQLLLLDEPTTGVDPVSRREFWDDLAAIADEGVTIIVATPYLDEAERCNRIALIHKGVIQQIGTLAQLRASLGCQRLEVRIDEIEVAANILRAHLKTSDSTMTDIQSFGDRFDVLIKDAAVGQTEVVKILEQHQLKSNSIKIAEPTLENVFVSSLRSLGNDPEFLPFPRIKAIDHTKLRSDTEVTHNVAGEQGARETRRQGDKGNWETKRGGKGDKVTPLNATCYQEEILQDKPTAIAISTEKLSKKFGNFLAVKDLDLAIRYGEIYGLLGANGAGKTTTIKMLCGLLSPTSGTITLAGETGKFRSRQLRQRIGYMSQKFTLYDDLTIIENLEFYCRVYGVPRELQQQKIDWVLATCGLVGQEKMLTGKLPGGWKQRVAFGASVMHEPEILFLDEPTSGVDPLARRQFWRLINDFARQGTAILVTTHYLEEAEHCNRMGFIVSGEIVMQGTPSAIKTAQPGQLIEIGTDSTQLAANLLKTKLESWRVSIFGDRLHLVLEHSNAAIDEVRAILQTNNIKVKSLQPIPFSLEDAFIGIVQRA